MAKTLGLDLGTDSTGWAIVERTESGIFLRDKGVHIFQEGVARVKGEEKPMVQTRTNARALRRHYYRRRLRKIELLKVLVANGLGPALSLKELDSWRYRKQYPMNDEFLMWQRTDQNANKNPYHDRYIALTRELDMSKRADRYLLGRALYHLSQRRGFLSNRKDVNNSEDGKVKGAIKQLEEDMLAAGCNYLGEFYYKLFLNGEKIRTGDGHGYAHRIIHYKREFDAICEKQNLSEELYHALYRAIFFQRPLKSQKGLVGSCTFEKSKACCPISHPCFEEFRMRSYINTIKIKTPSDTTLRMLSAEEVALIEPLFYRKSKAHFDFEDIAKKLSGGRKGSYAHISDRLEAAYRFNYKMSMSVSGSPMTAALRDVFGEDWLSTMSSVYLKGEGKTSMQILNDVWHILFSFDDDGKLREWSKINLQLNDEEADKFAAIPVKQGYAALSLNVINKILPYLRAGYRYDEAVFIANLPKVVSREMWSNDLTRESIIKDVCSLLDEYAENPLYRHMTKKQAIDNMLLENYGIGYHESSRLYEPSNIETYAKGQPKGNGQLLLGSPRTSSIRNPMAMRALFRLRALVNQLLKEGKIDKQTKINIEFARELNDANKRNAIERYQRENANLHKTYSDAIRKLFKAECGCDIEPSDNDILKYQLWKEQNQNCLYTGNKIRICDFIGPNPKYDIEHTIPRSRGGDNSQMNKTLCQWDFNRRIKREKLPVELSNHAQVMSIIEQLGWDKEIEKLEKQIWGCDRSVKSASTKEKKDEAIRVRHYLRMRLNYLRGKLSRFTMTEVPEGFSNRQGVDIGIIGKYAKMYLETVFDRVFTVKGATTADFRKMWGLQEEYSKKDRSNHIHHCIDAITIACIDGSTYAMWAQYLRKAESYYWDGGHKPVFDKPWPTFTEDVKRVADELLVSHHTANNLPKHSRKKLRIRGKVQLNSEGKTIYMQGDTARVSLHQDTFYGAIKYKDEVKYVVRKELAKLKDEEEVDRIVDKTVRECVQAAIAREGFKEAMSKPICFNEAKGVYIKKVRIFTSVTNPIRLKKHRDQSHHNHKHSYYVANEGNYCMAIYEGVDAKGRTKRSFQIVNNMQAAKFYNGKTNRYDLLPLSDSDDYPLKYILRVGTMVLFYEKSADELRGCSRAELTKRLYKVTGMSMMLIQKKYNYGMLTLKHHQEARPAGELKGKNGEWKMREEYRPVIVINHNQFNALVEGSDFELTVTGEIKFKH